MAMRRRELIAALGALPAMLARPGRAQQPQPRERTRRIGYLTPASGAPEDVPSVLQVRALVESLRQWGWVDGRNITIDHRSSGAGRERIGATAKALVESRPDVILTIGGQTTAAVLAET